MDALEFAREIKRMCDSHDGCSECDLFWVGEISFCEVGNLEKAVPIVEKWSKENPKVTNLDHIAEGLEKLGFEVDKSLLKHLCPPPYDTSFSSEYLKCPKDKECDECYKWWDEEYKEKNNDISELDS